MNSSMNSTITEEMLVEYKNRVGCSLRVNSIFNERATPEAIRRFCDGIGEGNPLYRNPEYASASPWGNLIAPPSFVMSVFPGWILQGLPGIHVFHSSTDFVFRRPVLLDDRIRPESRFTGFRLMTGKLGENSILEIQKASYLSENGDVFAEADVTGVRAERQAVRNAGLYDGLTLPHPWTEKELVDIEKRQLAGKPRGNKPLYFEEVTPGDEIPVLTKGPLGITDIIAYCVGACPVRLLAHSLALEDFSRRPAWGIRDYDSKAMEPVFSVHYNKNSAELAGMPYPYDIGSQRHTWLIQMLTNWMGDCGWLEQCRAKYTGFVFFSDVVTLGGKIVKKYKNKDEIGCVEIRTTAVNQRGETVMKGSSTVLLPSRADSLEVVRYIKGRYIK